MPLITNEELVIEVEAAAAGTWIEVGEMYTYGSRGTRSSSTRRAFMRPVRTIAGDPDRTITLGGALVDDDPGQQRLRTLKESGATGRLRVMPDGAKGFIVPFKVTENTHDADSANETDGQPIAFTLAVDGDPVAYLGGEILI
jgi:hypothetical protein